MSKILFSLYLAGSVKSAFHLCLIVIMSMDVLQRKEKFIFRNWQWSKLIWITFIASLFWPVLWISLKAGISMFATLSPLCTIPVVGGSRWSSGLTHYDRSVYIFGRSILFSTRRRVVRIHLPGPIEFED
jgi:hypothetical protein